MAPRSTLRLSHALTRFPANASSFKNSQTGNLSASAKIRAELSLVDCSQLGSDNFCSFVPNGKRTTAQVVPLSSMSSNIVDAAAENATLPYPLIELPEGDFNDYYYIRQVVMAIVHVSPVRLL